MSSSGPAEIRLDLMMKAARLVKRRTVAQRLCRIGAVELDGRTARAGWKVKPGQRIGIRSPGRWLLVEVKALPARRSVSRAEAETLVERLEDRRIDERSPEEPAR